MFPSQKVFGIVIKKVGNNRLEQEMYEIISFLIDNLFEIFFWIVVLLFFVIMITQRNFMGKGFLLIKRGSYKDAIVLLKNKLDKKPLKSSTYYALGYCYYMLGYGQHAINNFEKAIDLKLKRIDVFYLLAILYAEENKFDKASGYIDKGEEIQNKNGFLNKLTQYERNDFWGWFYYLKGEMDKSLEFYNIAIPKWNKKMKEDRKKITEYYASPCYRLGIIYLKKSDLKTAKKMFSLSLKASPESIFANKSQEELRKLSKEEKDS